MFVERIPVPTAFVRPFRTGDLVAACFSHDYDPEFESLWVAHIDERCHCWHLNRYSGSVGEVDLPVREIIGDAARLRSAGILLAHNHPSGDPSPSAADVEATRRMVRAAETIDLVVADHVVFADCGRHNSLRRMGLL